MRKVYSVEEQREWSHAYYRRHPARRLLQAARQRARRKGIPFSITEADVVIPSVCPATGIRIVCHGGTDGRQGGHIDSPSLDRIEPRLGYVPGNVRVLSHLGNSMKGASTPSQLRRFAEWVLA